ncbi:hypothetical protein TrispH2_009211 [Trichoplax sp. H2]|nr:hypothetical protein TrispH2_009211 [Trichoplax sp. H2]|eukprot:RDD40147.1 hypothetical protein TrispH2_009211 [Trichoplax sp. H2]
MMILLIALPYGSARSSQSEDAMCKETKLGSHSVKEIDNTKGLKHTSTKIKKSLETDNFGFTCFVAEKLQAFIPPQVLSNFTLRGPSQYAYTSCDYAGCSPKMIEKCEKANMKQRIEFEYDVLDDSWPSVDKKAVFSLYVPIHCACIQQEVKFKLIVEP